MTSATVTLDALFIFAAQADPPYDALILDVHMPNVRGISQRCDTRMHAHAYVASSTQVPN
jgi:DNA-binding response OmpR family regulator